MAIKKLDRMAAEYGTQRCHGGGADRIDWRAPEPVADLVDGAPICHRKKTSERLRCIARKVVPIEKFDAALRTATSCARRLTLRTRSDAACKVTARELVAEFTMGRTVVSREHKR